MRIHFYCASACKEQTGYLSLEEFPALATKRQRLLEWWALAASDEEKKQYGRVSDSAVRSLEQSSEMMLHEGYRCLWIEDERGEMLSFADWFTGSMPSMPNDEEFYEGGTSFFEGFNREGLSFGTVAYLYYVVTQDKAQGRGFARRLIAEMLKYAADEEADSVVSDLPLKPFCQRIIDICEGLGFYPTPRIVDDEFGNEWRQYAAPLGERSLVLSGEYAVGVES